MINKYFKKTKKGLEQFLAEGPKSLMSVIVFGAARHAFAFGLVIAAACVFWTVGYFTLLLWSIIMGEGAGSLITYPRGIFCITFGGLAVGAVLFLPATLVGEFLCKRFTLPVLIGIPLSIIAFGAFALFWSVMRHLSPHVDVVEVMRSTGGLIVLLMVPLGLYWWSAEFTQVIRERTSGRDHPR